MSKIKVEFPQPIEKEYNGDTFKIKPYLTSVEKATIISQAIEIDDYLARQNIIDTLVMRMCTDIEDFDNDEINVSTLDMYRACGIVDMVEDEFFSCGRIKDLRDIDDAIDEHYNLHNTLLEISTSIIDKLGDVDPKQVLAEFDKVTDNLKSLEIK